MRKFIFVTIISLVFLGCKPVIVNHEVKNTTVEALELGNIGVPGRSLLEYKFKTTAIPKINEKVRVRAQITNFNKVKFNAYLKASQDNKLGLVYVDSLENKPQFVDLKLIDKAGFISSLNQDTETLNLLKNQQNIKTITTLSIVFSNNHLSLIKNAESIFLKYSDDLKKSYLSIVDKNGSKNSIYFGDSVPFAYSISGFCWQENKEKEIVIANITDSWESCPANTYAKASKAVKKEREINYFKL